MELTIQIPSDLEDKLRDQALQKGKDLAGYVTEILSNNSSSQAAISKDAPVADHEESELLLQLQNVMESFSQGKTAQYEDLIQKRKEEKISASDLEILQSMSRELEACNVKRMEILTRLSTIRNQPLRTVMKNLGIVPPDVRT